MKVDEPENDQPISWKAILADTPVFSSDDQEVGTVHEVLGWEQEDIFHGVVLRSPDGGNDVMIAADQIREMTSRRIRLVLSSEEVRELDPHQDEESYRLGYVGLLRKRLGWVSESRDPE